MKMDTPLRRNERYMSRRDAEELLERVPVGRLGTSFRNEPYVVPLNFVYCDGKIYFHCAKEGKKLEYIARNQRICFEVDEFIGIKESVKLCSFGTYYGSVIAFGDARLVEAERKSTVLKNLVEKYAKEMVDPAFDQEELEKIEVVEILIESMTGKWCLPNAQGV